MSGNLPRRVAAAEAKSRAALGQMLVVVRRPDGLDPAALAAWCATEAMPIVKPQITVIIRRLTTKWPPRSMAEAQACVTSGLAPTLADLAVKIRNAPAFPEQAFMVAALPAVTLQ